MGRSVKETAAGAKEYAEETGSSLAGKGHGKFLVMTAIIYN